MLKALPQHWSTNGYGLLTPSLFTHNNGGELLQSYCIDDTSLYINDLIKEFPVVVHYSQTKEEYDTIRTDKFYIYIKKFEAYVHYEVISNVLQSSSTTIYYKERNKIEPLIQFIRKFKKEHVVDENYMSLITQKGNDLSTHSFKIKIGDVNIPLNYGESFVPKYDKIMASLSQEGGKGIVLLHGMPGTGKTSLIKYIAKNLTKKILFVPPALAGALCSPEFISFMMQYPNSILIIEDAEKVVSSREVGGNSQAGVSNILNISDGILGDCLNIQVVASFNTRKDNIDEALLRKGRLIVEHEFTALSSEESNRLLVHLGKEQVAHKPMTLTEIYNIDETEYKSPTRKAIGFVVA